MTRSPLLHRTHDVEAGKELRTGSLSFVQPGALHVVPITLAKASVCSLWSCDMCLHRHAAESDASVALTSPSCDALPLMLDHRCCCQWRWYHHHDWCLHSTATFSCASFMRAPTASPASRPPQSWRRPRCRIPLRWSAGGGAGGTERTTPVQLYLVSQARNRRCCRDMP